MKLFFCKSFLCFVFLILHLSVFSIQSLCDDLQNETYVVKTGDNIYRISLATGMTQKEILDMNNLKDEKIFVGQKLIIRKHKNDTEKQQNQPEKQNIEQKTQDMQVKKSDNNEKNNNTSEVKQKDEVNIKDVAVKDRDTFVGNSTFIWPTRGTIIAGFKYKTKTGNLEGVNIGCEDGSAVRAVSAGEVVYSDTIDGFGNVILIKHYNGFITAYGYTEPIVVKKDRVIKGQIIAYVAKPKKSKRSILYFSIRKNGKSYDPEKLIQTKISN